MTLTPPAGGRRAEVPPKPAASLLTVPIFRDQPSRRRANGAPAPVQVAPAPAAPEREPGPAAQTADRPAPSPASPQPARAPSERDPAVSVATDAPDVVPETPGAEAPAAPAQVPAPPRPAVWPAVPVEGPERPAAPRPSAAPSPASAPRPATAAPQPAAEPVYRDLRQYWRARMNGGLPRVEALDDALIARAWPYTMLIRVPADGALDIAHVYAPADGAPTGDGHPFAGDRYAQLSTWVLGLAGEAFGARQIREARETFDLGVGRKRFTARLLPCRRDGDAATYLLLQLQEG